MAHEYCMHCMEHIGKSGRYCNHDHNSTSYDVPVHHIKPGTVLREKYLIGRALGEGGFGITYIGRDLTLDMRIAVKEFYPNGYSHRNHNYTNDVTWTQSNHGQNFEKDMQKFLHEARMLAKFSDEPGVVGVRDFFRENGTAYIVMEYLDGVTLKAYLREHGPIEAKRLFQMIDPVLLSLARIHDQGMIHRDISPDNIMVLKNGRLKLLDFGAAREVTGDKSLSVVLKHGYAPEEQYRTKGMQGPWTDVYAMSATIYKCLSGVTPMESLERVYNDELVPLSKLGVQLTKQQETVLLQGLNIRIGDRIQDMYTLRDGLQMTACVDEIQSVALYKLDDTEEEPKTTYAPERQKLIEDEQSDEEKTVYQTSSILEASLDVNGGFVNGKDHCDSFAREKTDSDSKKRLPEENSIPKSDAERKQRSKKSKVALIAIAAILVIVCTLLPDVIKIAYQNSQPDIRSLIPTERILASDCSIVLKRSNVSGSVLDLKVQEEKLNEKYKTLVLTCDVTVLEGSAEAQYVVVLYYEYEDDAWVLGNLSEVKEGKEG